MYVYYLDVELMLPLDPLVTDGGEDEDRRDELSCSNPGGGAAVVHNTCTCT